MSGSTVFLFPDDNTAIVAFDLTKIENHNLVSTLTKNPVESGAVVTDQIIVEPVEFSCTVLVTNTPTEKTFENEGAVGPITIHIGPYPPTQVPFDALLNAISGPTAAPNMVTGYKIGNPVDRVKRMLDRLDGLRLAGQTMSVLTSKKQYDNMVLCTISMPIEKVDHAEFTLTFNELVIVTTDQVTAPKPKEPRGAPTTNAGSGNAAEDAVAKGEAMFADFFSAKTSILRTGAIAAGG